MLGLDPRVRSLSGPKISAFTALGALLLPRRESGPKGDESHFGGTGVRSDDLPAAGELLEIHGGISHHLLVGTREIDRPPGEGECEIWF